jgi:alcohol dehydrogenase
MKAVVYEAFGALPKLMNVADPTPEPHGVVVPIFPNDETAE